VLNKRKYAAAFNSPFLDSVLPFNHELHMQRTTRTTELQGPVTKDMIQIVSSVFSH